MEEAGNATSTKRRAKFALGGAVVAGAVLGLVFWAMARPGATAFYMTVSEVKDLGATSTTKHYRVNGNVVGRTLERDGVTTTFAITDGDEDLRVVTQEALPDAFFTAYENDPSSVEIVAEGDFDGKTFAASKVLAKCPSKFKAKT